jgi:hypothetical protein
MICSGWAAAPVADSRLAFPCCRLVDEKDAHTGYDLVSIVFFWWNQGQFSTYVVFHLLPC